MNGPASLAQIRNVVDEQQREGLRAVQDELRDVVRLLKNGRVVTGEPEEGAGV